MSINAKYGCPRTVFYVAGGLTLNNVSTDMIRFNNYKRTYSAALITALEEQLATIKLMPANVQSVAVSKEDRVLMIPMVDSIIFDFNDLKNYIRPTCGGNEEIYQIRIIAAGQASFANASSYKWAYVAELADAMTTYITNNLVALLAGENMPITFQPQVLEDIEAFTTIYAKYGSDKGGTKTDNVTKVEAENAFFLILTGIDSDGVAIARGVKSFEQRYTWSRNVSASGGHLKLSAFKGDVTTGAAHLPLEASIFIEELDLNFKADAKGKFHSEAFASGTYTIVITMPGFIPITLTHVEIDLHTAVTRHIVMVPMIIEETEKEVLPTEETPKEEEK